MPQLEILKNTQAREYDHQADRHSNERWASCEIGDDHRNRAETNELPTEIRFSLLLAPPSRSDFSICSRTRRQIHFPFFIRGAAQAELRSKCATLEQHKGRHVA
jgi:hypothetical protein